MCSTVLECDSEMKCHCCCRYQAYSLTLSYFSQPVPPGTVIANSGISIAVNQPECDCVDAVSGYSKIDHGFYLDLSFHCDK